MEARVIPFGDPRYPPLLSGIHNPPEKIYVMGQLSVLTEPSVAIVGSRRASAYGEDAAGALARALAEAGVATVSGLARGIDTAAHKASLQAGGKTIAVMGTGPDEIFPSDNKSLAEDICRQGALVTEYDPGTPGWPGNFPARNRIIAGLSLGTVVVEAAERSGALITARLAAEQGKEVFAVPGPISSPLSEGPHKLISQGAKLVRRVEDILEEIKVLRGLIPAASRKTQDELLLPALTGEEQDLLNLISLEPVSIDQLLNKSAEGAGRAANTLLSLELKGAILTLPGKRYVRSR
ncbi:MAG: DNA protecting protein DprA [Elusimicrobia bacterium RIFCSPLOWO2_01_FULL_54_10]|nr:MAG: DNA protecting protein DprA [Elusimicrobia bacterium RIFCSPLOWO2_01_FULL_54_10]